MRQRPYFRYGDVSMKKLTAIIVLAFGLCLTASADVWKWVDAYGKTHFVDTMTTIYTWLDESGKVHYSDKPEHANAVSEAALAGLNKPTQIGFTPALAAHAIESQPVILPVQVFKC